MEINLLQKLIYYNLWWQKGRFDIGIKREKYLKRVTPFLKGEEIIALVGVRRSGKTTLIFQLIDQLMQSCHREQILFLKADDEIISSYMKNQGLSYIIQEYLNYRKKDFSENLYVFVDEIQEIDNWETQLKNIFDAKKKIKFIISGSSASKLKSQTLKKLVGRIVFLDIYPLSFSEFVLFKENLRLDDEFEFLKIRDFVKSKLAHRNILKRNFFDYLKFGGYPRVTLENNLMVKEKLLRDYTDLILKRDIASIFPIEYLEDFEGMLKFLAKNISGKISFFKIAKDTGLKVDTVKKYYYYLKQSFMVFDAEFYKTTLKKTRRPRKFYFADLGVRNLLIGSFGLECSETEMGFLAENFIAQRLREKGGIKYFEDKEKNEVDFIVQEKNGLIPVEVKFKNNIKIGELKGIFSFLDRTKTDKAVVITKDLYKEEKIEKKEIIFVPAYYF